MNFTSALLKKGLSAPKIEIKKLEKIQIQTISEQFLEIGLLLFQSKSKIADTNESAEYSREIRPKYECVQT